MNSLTKLLMLSAIYIAVITFTVELALAAEPDDAATCTINVTVDQICEWEGASFADIDLALIDDKADVPEGSAVYTLWLNCNVALTADNTIAAQLDNVDDGGSDTLITEYYAAYDGDGATATGGTDTVYATHDNFISGAGSAITHFDGDGAVEITLWARASNNADEVADAGVYEATQTLTAAWTSN